MEIHLVKKVLELQDWKKMDIKYSIQQTTLSEIFLHLQEVNTSFTPTLSAIVDLEVFAKKIYNNAVRFEAWENKRLIGLLSVYFNDTIRKEGFLNHIAVVEEYKKQGISKKLMSNCINYGQQNCFLQIKLEVSIENQLARKLYENFGFNVIEQNSVKVQMINKLIGKIMKRDYNKEIIDNERDYAYSFDFDIMHPFMIRSFEPFFHKNGNFLELGCYKGDFTKRFAKYFEDITCVEASSEAMAEAKQKVSSNVKFINALFEDVTLDKKYDNIVLTHVLEHLDDPIRVLKRINDEWLSDNGRFFLVTPNAMAPSRQIAVKMGLITHNSAVTPAEEEHGHRITYTLDTLERDAKAAGLKVVHRSGIFFKALANFQWDRLLQTDIISKEYLDGCYELGQQYPELCSSIFLMCEKGRKC